MTRQEVVEMLLRTFGIALATVMMITMKHWQLIFLTSVTRIMIPPHAVYGLVVYRISMTMTPFKRRLGVK